MKLRLSGMAALLVVCVLAYADEKKPDPMMEAMVKAGTPGDAHRKLEPFAGKWSTRLSAWAAPGAEPMVVDGTAEARWVMGGRFLEHRFTGSFLGKPFEGLGYTGYDNVKQQYWSTWMDNFSTGLYVSTGTGDGTSWTYSGAMPDPVSGKDVTMTSKLTVTDADRHTMEMWVPGPDGKSFKTMEAVYTRKK